MESDHVDQVTPEVMTEMRGHLQDCDHDSIEWVDDMTDAEVLAVMDTPRYGGAAEFARGQ